MAFDKNAAARAALEQAEAEGKGPATRAAGPPPRRVRPSGPEVVDLATSTAAAPATAAPLHAVSEGGGAAGRVATMPPVAEMPTAAPVPTPVLSRPPDDDTLPGYQEGNRRVLSYVATAEVDAIVEKRRRTGRSRGMVLAEALKVASAALVERAGAEDDGGEVDPWDDTGPSTYRQHTARPVDREFRWSLSQTRAFVDLVERCGEQNHSRLICEAVLIAFGRDGG